MTAIGVVMFAICFFLVNYVFDDIYLFDRKKRDLTDTIFGAIMLISCILILAGIAIKLWEVMP